jgi:hypothetical protein
MNNQIEATEEIEQFVTKAAKFGAASGVTVAVELEDGKVMTQRWGAVEATSEPSEPTPETIRDAWTEIATSGGLEGWRKFQSMAAEYGLHRMKRPAMIDKLTDMGVMPGDDPSDTDQTDDPSDTDQTVFAAPRTDGMTSKALATADD